MNFKKSPCTTTRSPTYARGKGHFEAGHDVMIANTKGDGAKAGPTTFWVKAEAAAVLRPDRVHPVRGAGRRNRTSLTLHGAHQRDRKCQ